MGIFEEKGNGGGKTTSLHVPEEYKGMGLTTMVQVAMARNLFNQEGLDIDWYRD